MEKTMLCFEFTKLTPARDPNQCSELENVEFPGVFLRFLSETQIYDVFFRVNVTKYGKLHAYLSDREGEHSRVYPPLALKRNR